MIDDDEHPEAAAGPSKPRSEWKKKEVEALYDLTLNMNPDLFDLENQKDEVCLHLIHSPSVVTFIPLAVGAL